jgi:hypothetical protein
MRGQVDLLNTANARLYGRLKDDEAEGTAAGAGSVMVDLVETAKQSRPKRKRPK